MSHVQLLPSASADERLVISINIAATFHRALASENPGPSWKDSEPVLRRAISGAKIILIQEACQTGLAWLLKDFGEAYDIIVLAATPAEAPVGIYHHIAGRDGASLTPLINAKNLGTALVVTLVHQSLPVARASCVAFGPTDWYAGEAALIPADRGSTDKGFGNFNTVRGMLIVILVDKTPIINTHLPLSGGLATRALCLAQICSQVENLDAPGAAIIGGDMNLFSAPTDSITPQFVHDSVAARLEPLGLIETSRLLMHTGTRGTFVGFACDHYQNKILGIDSAGYVQVEDSHRLDMLCVPTAKIQRCGTLFLDIEEDAIKTRRFATDHALLYAVLCCCVACENESKMQLCDFFYKRH